MDCLVNINIMTKLVFVTALLLSISTHLNAKQRNAPLRMPDVRPDHAEQYICTSLRLPMGNMGEFIVGFNPIGSAERIHHMLLYGCDMPGLFSRDSPEIAWDCGEMMKASVNVTTSFNKAPICQGQSHILYAWAKDAPALKLPQQVGFKVGGSDTGIHFLVLQVHYAHTHAFDKDLLLKDNSGLILELKRDDDDNDITKRAGVLLMASNGIVKRGNTKHEISCTLSENIELHAFKFRVHTHKLGTKVEGFKIPATNDWINYSKLGKKILIGSGDPQQPQMFYDVSQTGQQQMTLNSGDTVYAYCAFSNNQTHDVIIGQTGDDEMCNFYIMYWTNGNQLLKQDTCVSRNPSALASLWDYSR